MTTRLLAAFASVLGAFSVRLALRTRQVDPIQRP